MGHTSIVNRDPVTKRLAAGGASLNPGGRPRGAERIIRDAVEARGGGWADLANAMIDMAMAPNGKPIDRQRAIEFLYDRVFGRPLVKQESSVTVQPGSNGPQRASLPSESFGTERLRAALAVLKGETTVIDVASTENSLGPVGVDIVDVNDTQPAAGDPTRATP